MSLVLGIDEAGRGCWAGPLVAAAVLIRTPISGLTDSKLLKPAERERLAVKIHENAVVGLGWVDAGFIDEYGLTAATRRAMSTAVKAIGAAYDTIIIDGKFNFLSDHPLASTMIKADLKIPAVSAASIVAKVARDKYMAEQAKLYPVYGFDKHVGYGTRQHIESLRRHGACVLHRLSYRPLKELVVNHD